MDGSAISHAPTSGAPRLLVLAPRYPYPLIGGDRLRIHHLCAELAKRYRLTLLCFCEDTAEAAGAPPPDGLYESIEVVRLPRWRARLNCLLALPTRVPLQLAYYRSRTFARRVAELAPLHDAIVCHLIRSAEYALPYDLPRVLEMTDAISLNYKRVRATAAPVRLRTLIYELEQARLERFERMIVDEFDAAVLVSSTDRDYLYANDARRANKVMVCSNGVDTHALPYQFAERTTKRIVFVGNMATLQNLDAAEWFARAVLPAIRERHPDAVLEIIGNAPFAAARRLWSLPGVQVVGRVPSIAAAVAGAAVGVCPMRIGAGVQNKLLEYMALGVPAVTSAVGLEGLAAEPGRHLLLADGADAMASAVLRLIEDRTLARDIAQTAHAYVDARHRWTAQLAPLLDQVALLLRQKRRSRAAVRYAQSPAKHRALNLQQAR
jgi:sugar transferase (PEP-CTERM/EpsH1 system associated)